MADDDFWTVIGTLDKSQPWIEGANWDAICAPAIRVLVAKGVSEIEAYFETFAQKLHAIDTPAHHRRARYGWFPFRMSSDVFLYARCHVVGLGRDLYNKVLATPKAFPRNMWAEHFLYIADHAYRDATGKDFPRVSSVNFESFSNQAWSRT